MQLTIQHLNFEVSEPYAEGHPLTSSEADALNRARAENINDRFGRQIKRMVEEHGGMTSGLEHKIRREFSEFMLDYEFPPVPAKRRAKDPLRDRARELARNALRTQTTASGLNWDNIPDSTKDAKVEQLLSQDESFMAQAGSEIDSSRDLANKTLEEDLF